MRGGVARCGVSSILHDGRQTAPRSLQPVCGAMMSTNCSVSYAPEIRCPKECPFVSPSSSFACFFECVRPDNCSVDRAFPNPESHLCEKCPILGCKYCDDLEHCKVCHPRFDLSPDRSACIFTLDVQMHLDDIVLVLGVLVAFLLLVGSFYACCMGHHPNRMQNFASILRARRHRHLVKVQDWRLDGPVARSLVDMFGDVQEKNKVGVGLGLYYNGIFFLVVISGITVGVCYWIFTNSEMSEVFCQFDDLTSVLLKNAYHPVGDAPAFVVSPLAACGADSNIKMADSLFLYAGSNYKALGMLYIVLFALSLMYAEGQQRFTAAFNSQNNTMSDFCIRIAGLPVDHTDEAALKSWLTGEFRKVCDALIDRSNITADPPLFSGPVEVQAVSICYDYRHLLGSVETML
ncbi:unnamed protein product, partial [Polarella glacialis]